MEYACLDMDNDVLSKWIEEYFDSDKMITKEYDYDDMINDPDFEEFKEKYFPFEFDEDSYGILKKKNVDFSQLRLEEDVVEVFKTLGLFKIDFEKQLGKLVDGGDVALLPTPLLITNGKYFRMKPVALNPDERIVWHSAFDFERVDTNGEIEHFFDYLRIHGYFSAAVNMQDVADSATILIFGKKKKVLEMKKELEEKFK